MRHIRARYIAHVGTGTICKVSNSGPGATFFSGKWPLVHSLSGSYGSQLGHLAGFKSIKFFKLMKKRKDLLGGWDGGHLALYSLFFPP